MYKPLFFILIGMLLFTSCTEPKYPEFEKIGNVNLVESNKNHLILSADLSFHNPNLVGGTMQLQDVDVLINDQKLGQVQSKDFEVPAQKDFVIPMNFKFSYEDIKNNAEGNILGILNSLVTKKLKVQYQGKLVYKLGVFSYDYPLDYTEDISLKK